MSRLKLLLLVLIIAALGIVFVQNQEPLALKLLCPDHTQGCLYQTTQLPLAVWIGVFVLIGMVGSLFVQLLDRYIYSSSAKSKTNLDSLEREKNWAMGSKADQYPVNSTKIQDSNSQEQYSSTGYEVLQEPQNVERSGSTYSYKYREASDRPKDEGNGISKSTESEKRSNFSQDDEDWI